jgi:hypothetical protein
MKLTKISYVSAVVFGALGFVMYLFVGALQWGMREVLMAQGYGVVTAVDSFVVAPVSGGLMGYLVALVVIGIYNFVAKKYPISWIVSKK